MTRIDGSRPTEGRPTKLTQSTIDKAEEYLIISEDEEEVKGDKRPMLIQHVKLPTIEGLANYIGVSKETLYQWEKENDKFSDFLTRVRNKQAERLINKGLAGQYNPVISKLLLSKHGYIEKQEVDTTINSNVQFINDIPRPKNINNDINQ